MQNRTELFQMSKTQFLLIFVFLFSLLSISSAWLLIDEIYIFALRKYIEPEIQKEFGFSSENLTFYYGSQKITAFAITKIEKSGLMEQADFRANDIPRLNVGCHFFYLNKSNEAIFYGILISMREGQRRNLEVVNTNDFANATKLRLYPYEKRRRVILEKKSKIQSCEEV